MSALRLFSLIELLVVVIDFLVLLVVLLVLLFYLLALLTKMGLTFRMAALLSLRSDAHLTVP